MMRPIELAPLEVTPLLEQRPKPRKTRLPAPVVDWRAELASDAYERVGRIAEAVRAVSSEWHTLFLALGGALLSRGLPPGELPAFLRAVSHAAGDTRTQDRELAARTTVQRRLGGLSVAGVRQLREKWPAVADALEEAFAPKPVEISGEPSKLETASIAIAEAIRGAGDGLTVIAAECGIGKSHALEQVALEREQKAPRDSQTGRAPKGTKTSISVPTTALAVQTAQNIRSRGGMVLRIFSPFSMKNDETGEYECRYREVANHLVEGRQSGQWELCEGRGKDPCSFKSSCRAYGGADGPVDARIVVGPHQLVGELGATAGTTGLLGIDEPPSMLQIETLRDDDFARTLETLSAVTRRYACAMKPALRALRGYLAAVAEPEEVCSAVDAVRHGSEHIDAAELDTAMSFTETDEAGDLGDRAIACARAAHYPDHRGSAPPFDRFHIERAKQSAAYAAEIGAASRVLWTIHRALTSDAPVSVRVEERNDHRCMLVTMGNESMIQALRREGSVVVLDANADTAVLAKLVGYEPPVHRFMVPDGAPVQRTHILSMSANGKAWKSHQRLAVKAIVSAVRATVDWILEEPSTRTVGIIAPKLVELALGIALGKAQAEDEWAKEKQTADPKSVRAMLVPLLEPLSGVMVLLGHYRALRGLNHMASVDALITLGDPWPNLGDARNEAFFLGLGDAWEARYQVQARAELEQAHGRLRAVQRTKPARALHIGSILPSGSAWSRGVEVRRIAQGRTANAMAMKPDEAARLVAALGGPGAAAKALGCGRATIHRYLAGSIAVPPAVSIELRRLAIEVSETDSSTEMVGNMSQKVLVNISVLGLSETPANPVAIGLSETSSPDDDPTDGGGAKSGVHRTIEALGSDGPTRPARGPLARFREAA